eukprot:scaffold2888_cov274-Pinguiococcus_pyrenoidosus.AAC.9
MWKLRKFSGGRSKKSCYVATTSPTIHIQGNLCGLSRLYSARHPTLAIAKSFLHPRVYIPPCDGSPSSACTDCRHASRLPGTPQEPRSQEYDHLLKGLSQSVTYKIVLHFHVAQLIGVFDWFSAFPLLFTY